MDFTIYTVYDAPKDAPEAPPPGEGFDSLAFPAPSDAIQVFLPAKVEGAHKWRSLRENVIKAIKQGAKITKRSPKKVMVMFSETHGIQAHVLLEIMNIANDELINFELVPTEMQIVDEEVGFTHGGTPRIVRKAVDRREVCRYDLRLSFATTHQLLFLQPLMRFTQKPIAFSSHFHEEIKAKPKLDEWINKARAGNNERREQLRWHWGDFAANGFQIHYDKTLPHNPAPEGQHLKNYNETLPSTVMGMISAARTITNVATLPLKELTEIVKQVMTIEKDRPVHLVFSAGILKITCVSAALGTSKGSIRKGYKFTGEEIHILINPVFLLKALSGMQAEKVTIRAELARTYITDGTREALIMNMAKLNKGK